MDTALENLDKSELIARLRDTQKQQQAQQQSAAETERKLSEKLTEQQRRIASQQDQIAEYRRLIFGASRERFLAGGEEHPYQTALPFTADEPELAGRRQQHTEQITYQRRKASRDHHPGRVKLPEHLPVEQIDIYPDGDLSDQVCIGQEVTDELEHVPARFYIKRYVRYKYAPKDPAGDGVRIGELPERVIDKGIPGPGLLAQVLIDKYVDHLPLYRQRQRFKRENIQIASSTLEGWVRQGLDRLQLLYDHVVNEVRSQGYLQADETPIRVLDPNNKKGNSHRGYYWVYHAPVDGLVAFDYQPTRGAPAPRRVLDGYCGYLQTDGYEVYDQIGARQQVTHLACWAHARRYFEKALGGDHSRASTALDYIQHLYAVERLARIRNLEPGERKELRLEHSLPVINEMGGWIAEQLQQVLPKSGIGKALAYSANRWDALSGYLYDGHLEIDNNLVENLIRPVALGRKNYLFAGSHRAAQRAAMVYSLLAMCRLHDVNPFGWLRHTLQHIMTTKFDQIPSLYPQNFKT